jgi:biopolymer transport protein ExbD
MSKFLSRKHKSRSPNGLLPVRPIKLWQDDSKNQEVRIDIVPLIDVIFCILTFFILAAVGLSRQQAISLDLPKANTGKPQMREMLVISLDDVGQVYVEQELVSKNRLYETLTDYHKQNPSGLTVLYASRSANYNEVVQVLDMLRQVGGDRVALATLPGESPKLTNSVNLPQSSPQSDSNPSILRVPATPNNK